MPRWVWFVPLGAITLALGLWGFRMGWIAATITETDVINTYAQKYLADRAERGSGEPPAATDCVAYPGQTQGIWLVVSCGSESADAGARYEYHVNRFGGLEFQGMPNPLRPAPRSPET